MPEKHRALYRGRTNTAGEPLEFLGVERGASPDEPNTPAVPPRHLTQEEYEALSPRNKVRVKEALGADGKPLYDVRADADMAPRSERTAAAATAKAEPKEGN